MRDILRKKLEEATGKNWSHVTTQIGMFCYSGLNTEQVSHLGLGPKCCTK
jgi:aspartate/tyrosine/aromatic aminotransferase